MKTQKIKTVVQCLVFLLLAVAVQSCETEIPPEDITPPKFSFRITGDGFDHTFDQDSDFENIILILRRNKNYDFTFSGSDDGGTSLIRWDIERGGYIRINSRIESPWTHSYVNPTERIQWEGNRRNPLTGGLIAGDFTAPEFRTFVNFKFEVADFGGDSAIPNEVSKVLRVSLGNYHQTRIGSR